MGSDLLMAVAIAVVGVLAVVILVVFVTRRSKPANVESLDEETTDHVRGRRRPTPRVSVAAIPPQAAPPYVPPAYTAQPRPPQPTQPAQPYLPPMPLTDDGPTTADPTWQAKAEAHYAQYRRYARGSSSAINDNEHDEQRTTLGVAPRPLQARPDGWDPAKSISFTVRSRNSKN